MSEFKIDGLAGEEAGEGVPVVLLHGLTATRRYVVMGSRNLERVLAFAALVQESGQRDGRVGAAGLDLERLPQRRLVAGRDERVGLGGEELVEEALDDRGRLRADELGDDPAVLEGLDGGDALDPEGGGEPLVGVGVELGERDLALALGDEALEHWG